MNLDVTVSIPVALRDPWTLQRLDVIDVSTISAKCVYENVHYDPEWTTNGTVLIRNVMEISSLPIIDPLVTDELPPPLSDVEINNEYEPNHRRRRRDISFQTFNQYTERLTEFERVSPLQNTERFDVILNDLPSGRTQIFECNDENSAEYCVLGRFSVHNFQMGNTPIVISLNVTLDLAKLGISLYDKFQRVSLLNLYSTDKVITEEKDKFVFKTSAQIKRLNDRFGYVCKMYIKTIIIITIFVCSTSVKTVQSRPYTIISKYHDRGTPIWVWIVSGLGGLLLLVLLTFGMYKVRILFIYCCLLIKMYRSLS